MAAITFRPYQSPTDIERQYDLWLRATEGWPYAWRSSLLNARSLAAGLGEQPDARVYAERDGELVGYIGCHPPFEWEQGMWAMPFGYPWTNPHNDALAVELYDRLQGNLSGLLGGQQCDILVQRFRSSWTQPLEFLQDRGWEAKWTHPILASRTTAGPGACDTLIQPVHDDELEVVAGLTRADPLAPNADADALRRRIANGWLDADSMWRIGDQGVFALDVRRPYAEIKLFAAANAGNARKSTAAAARAMARQRGASELYFTLSPNETALQGWLVEAGFDQTDADIYLTCPVSI
jgi:hypothetical protein